MRRRSPRGWVLRLIVVTAVLLAGAGLWSAASTAPSRSLEEQTREVARTLRCPSCAGEDVADSAAPLAEAMRRTVAKQLQEGRTPAQVRAWFAQRYGDEVLLDPPRAGAGWLLWLLPVAMLGGAVAVGARRRVTGDWRLTGMAASGVAILVGATWGFSFDGEARTATPATPERTSRTVPVLEHAVAGAPGDVALRLALARALNAAERADEAAEQYAAAARLRPFDPDITYLQGFALKRSGSDAEAAAVLEHTLAARPDHSPSLLLLGTMRWRAGDERGGPMLERFLTLDPGHPAAAEVRALLASEQVSAPAAAPADGGGP